MSSIIVTNNPYVYDKYKDNKEMIYKEDFSYLEILEFIRDKIHSGHELICLCLEPLSDQP